MRQEISTSLTGERTTAVAAVSHSSARTRADVSCVDEGLLSSVGQNDAIYRGERFPDDADRKAAKRNEPTKVFVR